MALTNKGLVQTMCDDAHTVDRLNVCQGRITNTAAAEAIGQPVLPLAKALA